jgi:predicted Ser/Thr protein kinase
MLCPSCGVEVLSSDRFCRSCGTPVSSISQAPTVEADSSPAPQVAVAAPAASPAPIGRLISSDSIPVGGFTPGMVLAGRYRIIGLIGRGGMGEVYRADDLKLSQPVALKFLPKALADDSVRRERLFAEVRIARQVSHPNIARVYDISEFEGRHFLTMEYIDGEDLASLLKRIGSLHGAKALDVARQLCAGLAAAHDKGVLHRDLKPANVMIDGRGRVRITDFGLAVAEEEEVTDKDLSGTPPYMAPEQFAGKGASVRSDIYALGLIFYEVFTGRRAFEAQTLAELRSKKESSSPTAPSEIARDIDPIVERVILRCIDKDPRQRPASAAQVAAALPGGDPLAAAIAAGETPSPEMVAASGSNDGLKPWIAWACLAFIILGIAAAVMLKQQFALYGRVPIAHPPDALVLKARDILKTIGYPDPPADSRFGFEPNESYLQQVEKNDRSPNRFDKLPALAIQFWYRQSPRPLLPRIGWNLTPADTLPIDYGEAVVLLDSHGNLTGLRVIPPEGQKPSGQAPDWTGLFRAAGFDPSKFTPVEPDWSYLANEDTKAAWIGALPDHPDVPIRIEAAARGGKPVSWRLIAPYREGISSLPPPSSIPSAAIIVVFIFLLIVITGGAFFVRRNLRMGRGDRRGAARLVLFFVVLAALKWLFGEHHMATFGEIALFLEATGKGLLGAGIVWLMYIALEPFVRRRWPGLLTGWSRLLSGAYRDSLIGRDLLFGCGAGVVWALTLFIYYPLLEWFGIPGLRPSPVGLSFMAGGRAFIAETAGYILQGIILSLLVGFIFFLVRVLFRSTWAALAAIALLTAIMTGAPFSVAAIPLLLPIGVGVFLFFRLGFLAMATELIVCYMLLYPPISPQISAWYSWMGLTVLALLLAFVLYAFHTSLGGQPMFGRASLED